ncbi:MAG: DUF3631 domain-containing protein [Thiotrichales bacterium]|nr:DUF3631 domain-containing protein [Thiotrichales bacterium]MCY4350128.1 DUF3631 domain-containing protein [Thiotrichales bacterium]
MSKVDSTIETAKGIQATKAEGELRKAAVEALKRNGLPEDLIERTKTLPGSPFEHPAALARLPDADRANLRKAFKDFAGLPVADFDKLTRASSGESSDRGQGRPIEWDDPEPWPEPVDGAALLDEISSFVTRYVSLPAELTDTVALWIAMTHIHHRLEISPFLNLTSATKRCGKSLLLEVLGEFVLRPLPVGGRITLAPMFRTIEMYEPTLLLDETDTYLRDNDELRGVVNGSQRRCTAHVLRCIGDDHEPRQFGTWCAKAMAGIGELPDTVLDRSIVLWLERRPPNLSLASWRARDRGAVETMRRKLVRWIADNGTSIVAGLSAVVFPSGLHDRARDAWEPLLAIGNAADGDWAGQGGRAWRACKRVMASTADEETGTCETLLADLRTIFVAKGWPEALGTKTVLDELIKMEDREWGEWSRGKPLSAHGLSKLLKRFGIAPRNIRIKGTVVKGYERTAFEDIWSTYLFESPDSQTATSLQSHDARDFCESRSATGNLGVADVNVGKPLETGNCSDVAFLQPPTSEKTVESTSAPVSMPMQPPSTERAGDAYRRARDGE